MLRLVLGLASRLLGRRPVDLAALREALEFALATSDAAAAVRAYDRAAASRERPVLDPRSQWELARVLMAEGRSDLGKRALEDLARSAPGTEEGAAARRALVRLATRRVGFRTEPRPTPSVL